MKPLDLFFLRCALIFRFVVDELGGVRWKLAMCLKVRERCSGIAFLLFIPVQVFMPILLLSMSVVFMSMFVSMDVGLSLSVFVVLPDFFELSKSFRHDSTQGYQSRINIEVKLVLQSIMLVSLGIMNVMLALLVEIMMFSMVVSIIYLAGMMVLMVRMMPLFQSQMGV